MSWVDVSVVVDITSLLGTKLGENVGSNAVTFDVSARLEEKERQSGRVVVSFGLTVRTKPAVVKYEVEGNVTATGKDTLIAKVLEVDPKSKIPFIFHRVYQQVFTAIYMLASVLGTIYPPPDLLASGGLGIPVKSLGREEQAEVGKEAEAVVAVDMKKQTKSNEPAAAEVKSEEAMAPQPTAAAA